MRRKRKLSKKFKNLLFFICVIVLIVFIIKGLIPKGDNKSKNIKEERTTYKNKLINNTDEVIDVELEKFLVSFFDDYYKSIKNLEAIDMKEYFSEKALKEYYIYQASIETLIASRTKQINDLKLYDAYYDLSIDNYELKDGEYQLDVMEDGYYNFNFMKNITSKSFDILNNFRIVKEKGKYKITMYSKEQDFYLMIDDVVDYELSDSDIKNAIDTLKEKYIKQYDRMYEGSLSDFDSYKNDKNHSFKKCDNAYHGVKASDFMKSHITEETEVYYGGFNGNSQNVVSWSLNAGGIPMDTKGYQLWKYYDSWLDDYNREEGRTASWTNTKEFYNYASKNDEYGLCSEVDVNTYYGEIGDILLMGYEGEYSYSSLVIDKIKDKNNNTIDILVASNTEDMFDYPISAFPYPLKSLIKVLGWNN